MSEESYTVYEPASVRKNLVERADELVFIKDGFSWWAALAAPLWMVFHRLWLPLIGFVVVLGILQIGAHLFGAPPDAGGALFFGLSLVFGFLANDFRRLSYQQDEYKLVGAVAGSSLLECERRFFDNWSPLMDGVNKQAADIHSEIVS